MPNHYAENQRIKRQYFAWLKGANHQSEQTVDAVAKALDRFEADTRNRNFKAFHFEQAVAFTKHLAEQTSDRTGKKLSKATLHATLGHLRNFFQWLSHQPGYRSRVKYPDAAYFSMSGNETRIAKARRDQTGPTLEQVKHVLATMPCDTDIERRNRALVAFTLATGARDGAIASMKLKHVDLNAGSVYQDASEVRTKFGQTFTTFLFPVGADVHRIVADWLTYLRAEKLWGNDDPLFPATRVEQNADRQFEAAGLDRAHWHSAAPIRAIFRDAFAAAGLPYFNPHSFRHTLARLAAEMCHTAEEYKSWSQNLGHQGVLTTFYSYGEVATRRQGEIIRYLAAPRNRDSARLAELVQWAVREVGNAPPGQPTQDGHGDRNPNTPGYA